MLFLTILISASHKQLTELIDLHMNFTASKTGPLFFTGLNLQSQFNLENVTVFNTNEHESTLGQKVKIPMSLFIHSAVNLLGCLHKNMLMCLIIRTCVHYLVVALLDQAADSGNRHVT